MTNSIGPLVLSAPFGNYVTASGATATVGTYTAKSRGGRPAAFGRAVLTTRYYRRLGAWVNQIGLRNPGINWIVDRPARVQGKILSVHGFNDQEWWHLLEQAAALQPLALELNISCPNVGELSWPVNLFHRAVDTGLPIIVKLPPVRYRQLVNDAVAGGVSWFHACNTLPVARGGMSGAPLKPVSLACVTWLRQEFGQAIGIIGGGGIRLPIDIADYAAAGANYFAVGTALMRPGSLRKQQPPWLADLVRAAAEQQHSRPLVEPAGE